MKNKFLKIIISTAIVMTMIGQTVFCTEVKTENQVNNKAVTHENKTDKKKVTVVKLKRGLNNNKIDDESMNTIKKISDNNENGISENINSDDGDLSVSLDEYLNLRDKLQRNQFFVKEKQPERYTETFNGLKIYETDFHWNGDLRPKTEPNRRIILHHIEASRQGETIPVTDIDAWHKANGWAGIGYHFYVTKKGQIFRGRPENVIGAHAKGENGDSIGIAVEGKYQTETMPKVQEEAVIKLSQYLRRKYHISTVVRHGDVNSTDCPGKNYPFEEVKNSILAYSMLDPNDKSFGVTYDSRVEGFGWQGIKKDGETTGTTGKAKELYGININTKNTPKGVNVSYKVYVADEGWKNWVPGGKIAGANNLDKRIEAVQIKLNGENSQDYNVEYRAHVQDIGWMPWQKNGSVAGTVGQDKRVEALQIRIVPNKERLGVKYRIQGENYGWQNDKFNGQLAGTTGKSLRAEGIEISLTNKQSSDISLKYRAHVQDIGWMPWVSEGNLAGTVGQAKRMEAIQLELVGKDTDKYNIEYRAHVQDIGWMPWKKNGEISGTVGQSKRIEAIEVRVLRK